MGWTYEEEPRIQNPREFMRAQTRLGWQRQSTGLLSGTDWTGSASLPSYGQSGFSTPKPDFGWMNKPLKLASGTQWSWSRSGMTLAPAAAGQSYLSVDASSACRGSASTPSLGLDSRFDDFESWGREHNRECGPAGQRQPAPAAPDPEAPDYWQGYFAHQYGSDVATYTLGMVSGISANDGWQGLEGLARDVHDNWWRPGYFPKLGKQFLHGLNPLPADSSDLERAGSALSGDLMLFAPALGRLPNFEFASLTDLSKIRFVGLPELRLPPQADPYIRSTIGLTAPSDELWVMTHGSKAGLVQVGSDMWVDHRALGALIERAEGYVPGMDVKLYVCYAGSSGLAQDLANKLGAQVTAATREVCAMGRQGAQPAFSYTTSGRWLTFYPGNGIGPQPPQRWLRVYHEGGWTTLLPGRGF